MNIYYLGSSVWGNNPSCPISILHVIHDTTVGTFIANFATVDEGLIFGAECGSIKESIAHTLTRGRRVGGSTRENTRNPFIKNGYLWCKPSLSRGGGTWSLTICALLLMVWRKMYRYQEQRVPLSH